MQRLSLKSPAKINLLLKILGKRRDGYHSLLTVFQRISLADTLRLTKRRKGFFLSSTAPGLSAGEDNLITRAYRALAARFPDLGGVSVRLEKNIPLGAGLGGGSSNAAHFLLGMKRLYNLKISAPELREIARGLGADVPFFLYDASLAVGTGRGDRIDPRPSPGRFWIVLATSEKGLSTKQIYEGFKPSSRPPSLTRQKAVVKLLFQFLAKKKVPALADLLENDLEASAFLARPSLKRVIAVFKKCGARTVRMSGSGPTVFALFGDAGEARSFARRLRPALPSREIRICHSY